MVGGVILVLYCDCTKWRGDLKMVPHQELKM